MSTIVPFSLQAGVGCPGYASLALALAAEFRRVDGDAAERALDALADEASAASLDEPRTQLDALAALAAGFERRRAAVGLDDLFVDRVLASRHGHPLAVACVLIEAARRASLEMAMVGDGLDLMLAHAACDEGVILDVAGARVRRARNDELPRMRWRCSHQVAFALLRELIDRSLRAGDLPTALRALELRLALPLDAGLRRRVEAERAALRARLN